MKNTTPFAGSYTLNDVQFLLKPMMTLADTPVHVKEALIQSGQKHYSEMLTHESLPPDDYLPLFYRAIAADHLRDTRERHRLAARDQACFET